MPASTPPPLRITGRVYDRGTSVDPKDAGGYHDYRPGADLTKLDESDIVWLAFEPGDVRLDEKSDMMGRAAKAGRHTNYGYSGYFRARIFTGRKWSNLAIWHVLPNDGHHYASQTDKIAVLKRLSSEIEARAQQVVTYRDRQYRFSDEPEP